MGTLDSAIRIAALLSQEEPEPEGEGVTGDTSLRRLR